VLFFGDLFTAQIATIGINPSKREYLDRLGRELTGPDRRFHTLTSLEAGSRNELSAEQCDKAIEAMQAYFRRAKTVYGWFKALDRVTRAIGCAYESGEAVHLDLVQEATDPTWSMLKQSNPEEAQTLLASDLPFLRWLIEAFPLKFLVCNGWTVFDVVRQILGARIVEQGRLARIVWSVATTRLGDRTIGVAGWNIPLSRPTGLGIQAEEALGRALRSHLDKLVDGDRPRRFLPIPGGSL